MEKSSKKYNEKDYEDFFDMGEDLDKSEISPGDDEDDENNIEIPVWNLITAFDAVLEDFRRNDGKVKKKLGKSALEYLMSQLKMTKLQILIIAILIDEGDAMTWLDFSHHFNVSRLRMMTYTEEMENLVYNRRWLVIRLCRSRGEKRECFDLMPGVVDAVRHNKLFIPEKLEGLDEQKFVEKLCHRIDKSHHAEEGNFDYDEKWMMLLVEKNQHLPLCHYIKNMRGDIHDKSILLLVVHDYAGYAGLDTEGLSIDEIESYFGDESYWEVLKKMLTGGSHELIRRGVVEYKCNDGLADNTTFVLSLKAKNEFLSEFKPKGHKESRRNDRDLLSYKTISKKALFYNDHEAKQIDRLRQMLSQEQFIQIQKRLAEKGMRKGIAVLLSGGPGTGKTELVKQISRETHRDLLMIDISQVKDCFVGNSEKNTKAIFERYKRLCQSRDLVPLLFINEADSLLGKRLEHVSHSSDQMLNSMQNIFLQCIEDLEGILICTTNLASNLDKAFDRRFLVKIQFEKPSTEVRAKIWQTMLPTMSQEYALTLAEKYDLSGGQCENVTRKATIEYAINGAETTFEQLDIFCQEELSLRNGSYYSVIGFH